MYKRQILTGFTKQMALYLKASDVCITKPGGLSSTEAAVANIPFIHAMAIPGCETRNLEFFESCGMSIGVKKTKGQLIRAVNRKMCIRDRDKEAKAEAPQDEEQKAEQKENTQDE